MTKSMKKFNLFICSLFAVSFVNAQAPSFQWADRIGGTYQEEGYSIATDASGNVYTTGYFSGTVDFDPGVGTFNLISNIGNVDVFISKLDASGNFVWAKNIAGNANVSDYGYGIAVDAFGSSYITGIFTGTADFDPNAGIYNLTSTAMFNIFILKLDASGNFAWAKQIGGASYGQGNAISVDASSNVYTTGFFQGTTDFDPNGGIYNLTSGGVGDIFISKLDVNGNFVWAKAMNGSMDDTGQSIVVDAFGNVYTTGVFQGTVDFDPNAGTYNLTSAGQQDIFISKLDVSGNFVWAKQIGDVTPDYSFSIALDASNNVCFTGHFTGTVDFDPGVGTFNLTGANGANVYVAKLDVSGNFVWAALLGGQRAYSIATDASGNIYSTGYFSGTTDFDPGFGVFNLTAGPTMDIYLSKLDVNGNFKWAKSMGAGNTNDIGYSITIDASYNVYTTGLFGGTVDFDPTAGTYNLTSAGANDLFIQKLGQCSPVSFSQTISLCAGQSITVGVNTYNITGVYTDVLTSVSGCDSTVTTNLTVKSAITGSQTLTLCFGQSITVGQNNYNTTGVYTDILTAADGCDSTLTTNLTVNPAINVGTTLNGLTLSANLAGATYQWLNNCPNYTLIAGATNQSYTVLANGSYAVIVTVGNCSDTSLCTTINTVGFEGVNNEIHIAIYPNPTNGVFNVELIENAQIIIINTLGEVVLNELFGVGKQQINIQNCVNGIYFVQAIFSEKQRTFRLIKW